MTTSSTTRTEAYGFKMPLETARAFDQAVKKTGVSKQEMLNRIVKAWLVAGEYLKP